MNFKKWLRLVEMGTGSNAVAALAQPIGISTRMFPSMVTFDKPKKRKKKHRKKS
jgi:hypothetical protein